jgi:ATP-dependent DNA helicase DinG
MAQLIETAIAASAHTVIEAPTGVGKSLAYLIPAILSSKRTVISTATHALQSQLIEKDLPFLARAFEEHNITPFSYAIAKGKENYVCGASVRAITEDPDSAIKLDNGFIAWAADAVTGGHTGDKMLLGDKTPSEWPQLNASNCYKNCRYNSSCGYIRSMGKIRSADVVVANHSMVGFDAALTTKVTQSPLFGPYEVLILDEAHNAARYIRDALASNAHEKLPETAKSILERQNFRINPLLHNELVYLVKGLFTTLPQLPGDAPVSVAPIYKQRAKPTVEKLLEKTAEYLVPYKRTVATVDNNLKNGTVLLAKEELKYRACKEVVRRFEDFTTAIKTLVDGDDQRISYIRMHRDRSRELVTTPLSVGPYLREVLYPKLTSVIATSATLAVNGSFGAVKHELGLNVPTKDFELRLKSPFDFDRNAIFYISRALTLDPPAPDDTAKMTQYAFQVAQEIAKLSKITDGRAFVLFTSSKELEAVYAQLLRAGLNLKKQDASNRADYLQQWFREESKLRRRPVLLGLKSFWEGVSIEGDDLSLVIIVKMPFPQQDPIYEALCKRANDSFNEVTFPFMVRELQQGAGRLIRTMTDRGVIAILDRRLTTKPYGGKVLNSLPFGRPVLNIADVEARYRTLTQ